MCQASVIGSYYYAKSTRQRYSRSNVAVISARSIMSMPADCKIDAGVEQSSWVAALIDRTASRSPGLQSAARVNSSIWELSYKPISSRGGGISRELWMGRLAPIRTCPPFLYLVR